MSDYHRSYADQADEFIKELKAEVARLHACLKERDAMVDRMEAEVARLRDVLELILKEYREIGLDDIEQAAWEMNNTARVALMRRSALKGEAP